MGNLDELTPSKRGRGWSERLESRLEALVAEPPKKKTQELLNRGLKIFSH